MKDFTKLIIDLISFGSQLDKSSATIDQMMSCLGGIVFNENLAALGTVDFDEITAHLRRCKSNLRGTLVGSDNDIDVRARLAQGRPVSIKDIIEFHGRLTVKLNDGTALAYESRDVTHF